MIIFGPFLQSLSKDLSPEADDVATTHCSGLSTWAWEIHFLCWPG